ncbi:hypothetical protein GCK72_011507 [Caenorhabditis remanei]|uniref:C2H2-type domain-containing protein n=1 Tax=Caenorhabditis remanei TaxID=31234 RepID=A0A6A5H8S9_CAERE|nr:hypothetical protein GCK72_011507 [Caenorhabditis remanei]KAF1763241.1 hypothetical protein GCK72_011507 [Caenorhabditis remanei]
MSDSAENYAESDDFGDFDEEFLEFHDDVGTSISIEIDSKPISTAERLEKFPEMYQIPARKRKRSCFGVSDELNIEKSVRRDVKIPENPKNERKLTNCEECKFWYRSEILLHSHIEQHKNPQVKIRAPGFVCPYDECTVRCDCQETLNKHVKIEHNRHDLVYDILHFDSWDEFERWKENLEFTTMSRFVHASSKKNYCGRSLWLSCYFTRTVKHFTNSKSASDLIMHRNKRSKKSERACTAHFVARETFGHIEVRACLTHCGHEGLIHIHNLPLSKLIKSEIANELLKGMTEEEIVRNYRETCPPTDRRFYIRPYEVRNVYSKLFTNQTNEERKKEISEMMELFEERKLNEISPILEGVPLNEIK